VHVSPPTLHPVPASSFTLRNKPAQYVPRSLRWTNAVTARSPIERMVEYKKHRGFANLPFVSDVSGDYTRAYVNPSDADVPGFSVFTRRNGTVYHFYSGEMSGAMADPRTGSARCPRPGPSLANVGSDAGRSRQRLVPEARVRSQIDPRLPFADRLGQVISLFYCRGYR
jgi:hypothetical protein